MAIAYIGLGSNLSEPTCQLRQAVTEVNKLSACNIISVSSLYFSRPMGPQDQPDYINAVLALETSLTPIALLDNLQKIENDAGRVRKDNRWGARILDLDILLYDDKVIESDRLTIPHYGLKLREFVLIPLAEIAPDLLLPCGDSLKHLSESIDNNGLAIYDNSLLPLITS